MQAWIWELLTSPKFAYKFAANNYALEKSECHAPWQNKADQTKQNYKEHLQRVRLNRNAGCHQRPLVMSQTMKHLIPVSAPFREKGQYCPGVITSHHCAHFLTCSMKGLDLRIFSSFFAIFTFCTFLIWGSNLESSCSKTPSILTGLQILIKDRRTQPRLSFGIKIYYYTLLKYVSLVQELLLEIPSCLPFCSLKTLEMKDTVPYFW